MDLITTDESMDLEHDHLEADDIEALLPTPMAELPSLELSNSTEVCDSNDPDPMLKEPEIDKASNVAVSAQKQDGDVVGTEKSAEVWEPEQNDVLTGRGANVNLHPGNQKFRALCYAHKAIFDVANHAAKRRIATEIWTTCQNLYNSRFLSKSSSNADGPWIQQNSQKAIFKAAQTIRDYQRPDRILHCQSLRRNNKIHLENTHCDDTNDRSDNHNISPKKRRMVKSATPMDHVVIPPPPQEPVYENPDGVETNDVLCGRGAFVNGHSGNMYLRELAMSRKCEFDAGNYTEKRKLATEIVTIIQQLQPPGRFLTFVKTQSTKPDTEEEGGISSLVSETSWEEVGFDKAILKACQVMRDIDRPDRKYRVDRKLARLNRLQALTLGGSTGTSNDDQRNLAENVNEQNCGIDTVHEEDDCNDTIQLQEREQSELRPQENGADSNGINAIISDVVDNLATSMDNSQYNLTR